MKRRDKRQLLDLLKTMETANQMLVSMLRKNRLQEITEILANEQDAALSIGNRIEQLEGEGTEAVGILEKYCEVLWEITQTEDQCEKKGRIRELSDLLAQEKVAIDKIRIKLDVVFLPYKASMWDCMETIWRAAQNDPDCNVVVLPIPYFDLNPDGTSAERHYEADLLPDYVPVVSEQDYDIKKEHPDIIYIHNPYDNYNRVTSVHPNFYSAVLKENSDMLVYVPYFSTGGRMPESHRFLPSYHNVDRIIVESEQMAEDINEEIPREKLLVAGSPKVERVRWMEAHKDQVDFPEEWRKKAEGKKVLLYNISITGLLHSGEKILDKMEEVFQIVSTREEIILLWRPHPLLESTLRSMRPELQERYRRLMRWFKKKNIGILDNTPDPDLAVVFADAYIGENSSSIVDLFRVVDKPRLFLTEERYYQPTVDEMQAERTYDVCKVGDDLWFVTIYSQLLCKCDLKTGRVIVVAEVPETSWSYRIQYVGIINYENKIILVPYRADGLCVYDLNNRNFVKHYFRREYVEKCFGLPILYQHYLFLTPLDYPAIVRYDILTGEFLYFDECIQEMMNHIKKEETYCPFAWLADVCGREFFLASSWSNQVLSFNMENFQYRIMAVGEEENRYRGIVSDETDSWLIVYDSPKIVKWNRESGETTEYDAFPEGFVPGALCFKNLLDIGSEIYAIAFQANHSCKLDKKTGTISFLDFSLSYAEDEYASEYYERSGGGYDFGMKISENELLMFSLYDNSFFAKDIVSGMSRRFPLRMEERLNWEAQKKFENRQELTEIFDYTLAQFIEYIMQGLFKVNVRRGISRPNLEKYCGVGKKIHQCIKADIVGK